MRALRFFRQTCTLVKKDLLLVGIRNWHFTLFRALILPVVVTFVLGYVRILIAPRDPIGIQAPSAIISLHDAFQAGPKLKFVFVDHHLAGADVRDVINELNSTARHAGKQVLSVADRGELLEVCQASARGTTDCFAAVEFFSSPDQAPGAIWNYSLHLDLTLDQYFRPTVPLNQAQIYAIPLQHTIDSLIARSHDGPGLPENIQQFAYTLSNENHELHGEEMEQLTYEAAVETTIGFVFLVAICGSAYHLTGHITQQREKGLLRLIDAMLPNSHKWECVATRILASHLAFDIIYAPGWIASGAIAGAFAFPFSAVGVGWYILLYLLTGLALSSCSILVSSFFKREQLGAITAVIIVLILGVVAQYIRPIFDFSTFSTGVWACSVFFPPCTFLYFIFATIWQPELISDYFINWGREEIQWFTSPLVVGGKFFACFVFQVVLYPILAALIEQWLHGQSSRSRIIRDKEQMSGNAVRLSGFTKYYTTGLLREKVVKAVERLDLNLYAGSITILLGTNGSGKTTTLNAIAGLETITEGRIEIDASAGIGLCPQTNVHWDAMTVEEHVAFFERLKRPYLTAVQSRSEIEQIILDCDLGLKRSSRAKTLSGGQMRKLQLAMMLAGGSKVCCIDEASSGIDPLARRKIWDVLLQERGKRTMILSTHFLDESEVLSDHVAILSRGQLKAEGSVASLKHQFGGGFHVVVPHPERLDDHDDLPQGYRKNSTTGVFAVSHSNMLTPVINLLTRAGITDYRIRAPTIEDVFLKLAEEMKTEHCEDSASDELPPVSESEFSDLGIRLGQGLVLPALNLDTGQGCSALQQTRILFMKRVTILRHNYMPYFWALAAPLVLAAVITKLFISEGYYNGYSNPCSLNEMVPYWPFEWSQTLQLAELSGEAIFGPVDRASKRILRKYIPDGRGPFGYYPVDPQWYGTAFVNSTDGFFKAIHEAGQDASQYKWGGLYMGEPSMFAFGAGAISNAVLIQAMHNTLATNMTFAFGVVDFANANEPPVSSQAIVATSIALGFTLYPGLLALYPTAERLRNVRLMQYSNGILSSSLWLAHALFDLVFILIISVFTTVIWAATHHGWYGLGYVFIIILLYGIAATLYSYVISLWAKSQVAALACTCVAQTIIIMLFIVGYVVVINRTATSQLDSGLNWVYFFMAPLCPGVSLLRAMLVSLNVYSLACDGLAHAKYPGGITYFGGPILYLTVQSVVYILLLVYLESGRSLEIFGVRKKLDSSIIEEIEPVEGEDIYDDEKHLTLSEQGLRLFNLTKTFGPVRAVENVNLGVLPSEKFALLGPNGAGKSTIISLVRGMLPPDVTDPPAAVWISGDSLMNLPIAAKNHLGVCPQFDAVDTMTLAEHLHFYARARGVPNREANVQQLITTLGLKEHANKLSKNLSGGTKRKLSIAIALIANPSVLLFDEPSSGMDPAAKRTLWSTLTSISTGRSLLLTTHSMEEAAALCDRAGIMSTKMLALGSIADLCAHHGDNIHIHIVHENAPYTSADDMDRIWMWVKATFVVTAAERRSFGGQLRFAVPIRKGPRTQTGPADGSDMGRLYRIIEEQKTEMGIRDYSIGPTTLDQVFLNVVSKHDVVEENWEPEKRRWEKVKKLLKMKRRGSDLSQWSFATEDS